MEAADIILRVVVYGAALGLFAAAYVQWRRSKRR